MVAIVVAMVKWKKIPKAIIIGFPENASFPNTPLAIYIKTRAALNLASMTIAAVISNTPARKPENSMVLKADNFRDCISHQENKTKGYQGR